MQKLPLRLLALGLAMPPLAAEVQHPVMHDPFDLRRLEHGQVNATLPARLADLQHYALTQLRMVGTIGTRLQRIALLLDTQNHVYLVTQGSKIGPDQGVVQQVNDDGIVLREIWQDAQGQKQERTVLITMDLK